MSSISLCRLTIKSSFLPNVLVKVTAHLEGMRIVLVAPDVLQDLHLEKLENLVEH